MALSWPVSAFPNGFRALNPDDIAGLERNFPALVNWLVSCLVNEQHKNAKSSGSSPVEGLEDGRPLRADAEGEEIEVVTDISFAFDSSNRLVATLSKKKVRVLEDVSDESGSANLPMWKEKVVVGEKYDESSHTFSNLAVDSVRTAETSPYESTYTRGGDVFEALQIDVGET